MNYLSGIFKTTFSYRPDTTHAAGIPQSVTAKENTELELPLAAQQQEPINASHARELTEYEKNRGLHYTHDDRPWKERFDVTRVPGYSPPAAQSL